MMIRRLKVLAARIGQTEGHRHAEEAVHWYGHEASEHTPDFVWEDFWGRTARDALFPLVYSLDLSEAIQDRLIRVYAAAAHTAWNRRLTFLLKSRI